MRNRLLIDEEVAAGDKVKGPNRPLAVAHTSQSLRSIIDAVPIIVWTCDDRGTWDYVNRRWHEFTGQAEGDSKINWLAAVHPGDRECAREAWAEANSGKCSARFRYRLRSAAGGYRWFQADAQPQLTSSGQLKGWHGTCSDVNDSVLAQEALTASEALNHSILASSPDCIKLLTLDGHIIYCNPLGPKALDLDEGVDLTGACWFDLVEPHVAEAGREAFRKAAEGRTAQFTVEQTTAKGRVKWFNIIVSPVLQQHAETEQLVFVAREITAQKKAEAALQRNTLLYRGVLEASADCIKIIDLDGRLTLMNSAGLCALELFDFEEVRGKNWASLWPAGSRATAEAAVAEALSGRVARFSGFCPTAKGTPKWWDVVVSPMVESGKTTGLLSISRDITESRRTAERLRQASEQDALTELPNRRSFQVRLDASVLQAKTLERSLGLLLIDLDHFKHVNDTLGHSAGDHLLKCFAKRLKGALRAGDFVARLGGDEFAVILEDVRAEEDLIRVGNAVLARLQPPITYDGRALRVGASIGGSIFPRDAGSAQELFNSADTALYSLKGAGRGGTKLFHGEMRNQVQQIASQLHLARVALTSHSVEPYYQPKVDLISGRICGFEALLRWKHPSRGLLGPDCVAESFKHYELASKIGELMQEKVFAEMARWRSVGLDFGRVAINAAPAEFLRGDYADRLLARLERRGLPGHLVEVEVTEHVFVERGAEFVNNALSTLDRAGVRIALDDFGTGYSSLSHLRDFPVHVVKVDKSFIDKMLVDPDMAAIVAAVIGLAKNLRIEVVAEGVETEAQRRHLSALGCDVAQGYLFGRPMDAQQTRLLIGGLCPTRQAS
jgi:diguanylate cyclase (GGDEF)-like protein/PAS domain S-box-containing protein